MPRRQGSGWPARRRPKPAWRPVSLVHQAFVGAVLAERLALAGGGLLQPGQLSLLGLADLAEPRQPAHEATVLAPGHPGLDLPESAAARQLLPLALLSLGDKVETMPQIHQEIGR